ncbi:MAG: YidC/Oxa1 family insertase periplasmic-domain containing protein [Gemmatimonadetes bacterium]|nr:YidC/Oxa1 family insertase periplasmic-domain containing protein [Gemmatimonadota bacterium]
MEKRFFLALLLTGVVVAVTPLLVPKQPTVPVAATSADSAGRSPAPTAPVSGTAPTSAAVQPRAVAAPVVAGAPVAPSAPSVSAETLVVQTPHSALSFSTLGAAPFAVRLDSYPALNRGAHGTVVLKHGDEPLLRYRVIAAGDTIAFDQSVFTASRSVTERDSTLTFTATRGTSALQVQYRFARDSYVARTTVSLSGVTGPAFLLVDLPHGFDTQEADTVGDVRLLAYSVKPVTQGARGTPFSKLDSGEKKLEAGPLSWVVAKDKYFLVGLLAPIGGKPFAEAHLEGGARTRKQATRGTATVVMALDGGRAEFEMYAGPQSWQRLVKMGREFETANPYGGWLQPIVQPFSTIVMRMLLWMKRTVRLDYGWVLVIFGVAVRLIMWPLNQSAMRSSIKMQRLQPELQEVQAKYKSDPQKQQQEIMRVYREHGMSPFSPLAGCLPALIPMPVLMALFFVFQNTIEFRGVPFLWLHDISLADPLYILPLAMGASMAVLSWIGMRNAPPNPQAKMMAWMFPAMLTMVLLNSAAGLSLYYFIQNLAALPQQWLIANERAKAATG